jgi:hypothetical protein
MAQQEREKIRSEIEQLLKPFPYSEGQPWGNDARHAYLSAALSRAVLLLDESNERLSASSDKLATTNIWLTVFVAVLAFVQVGLAVLQFLFPLATK